MRLALVVLAAALPLSASVSAAPLDAPAAQSEASAAGAPLRLPLPFLPDCPVSTGRSATLLLPPDASILQPGGALAPGDEIAVVTADGGCAGAGTWAADGLALTVWADDPFTPLAEGLVPGAPLRFMVREAATGTIHPPDAITITYADGYDPTGGFQVDDLYVVASRPTGSELGTNGTPLALGQNFPNPVRSHTTVPFSLDADAPVALDVFDALGRHVLRVAEGEYTAGDHTASLDASGLASGVYVVRLRAGEALLQRRLVVAR